jgi:hypothetical protein
MPGQLVNRLSVSSAAWRTIYQCSLLAVGGSPRPDDEPCGAYLLVLAGRVVVESVETASHPLETLRPCAVGELRAESPLVSGMWSAQSWP